MVTGTRSSTRPLLILIIAGSLGFLIFQSAVRQRTIASLTSPIKEHFQRLQDLSLSFAGPSNPGLSRATQSCEVCVVDPDNELCKYGLDNVRQSKAFGGSGYRVRKFLEKAMRGEEVRIGVRPFSLCVGGGFSARAARRGLWGGNSS